MILEVKAINASKFIQNKPFSEIEKLTIKMYTLDNGATLINKTLEGSLCPLKRAQCIAELPSKNTGIEYEERRDLIRKIETDTLSDSELSLHEKITEKLVSNLSIAVKKSSLLEPINVYRVDELDELDWFELAKLSSSSTVSVKNLIARKWSKFISTTIDKNFMEKYKNYFIHLNSKNRIIYEIELPKGLECAYIECLSDRPEEKEVLIIEGKTIYIYKIEILEYDGVNILYVNAFISDENEEESNENSN